MPNKEFMLIDVDNSLDAAIKDGKWKNPGASLYDQLLNAVWCKGKVPDNGVDLDEMVKKGDWVSGEELLKEAYLVVKPEKDKINHSPYGYTPFSRSGCKYPHHVIKDKKLVLSIPGVKAAYARLKQMGMYNGAAKKHIDGHIKELGLDTYYNKEGAMVIANDAIAQRRIDSNFDDISKFIFESIGGVDDVVYESTNSIDTEPQDHFVDKDSVIKEAGLLLEWIDEFVENDEFRDSIMMEASHRKLKYDFRLAWDYDTGHQVKIVYSLDGINVTDVGTFYDDLPHDQYLAFTRKNIAKKGNLDHQSTGQKVLAIVDIVTGQRLQNVKAVAPICPGIYSRHKTQPDLQEFQQAANANPDCVTELKVGTIDNTKSYKSTHWFTRDPVGKDGEDLRFRQIAKAEVYGHGRGHKINNLMARDFKIYGDTVNYNIFHNPNKDQALKELKMRERDCINFIDRVIDDLNNERYPRGYSRDDVIRIKEQEENNLRIVRNDIRTIKSGHYDLSMMSKYRESGAIADFDIPRDEINESVLFMEADEQSQDDAPPELDEENQEEVPQDQPPATDEEKDIQDEEIPDEEPTPEQPAEEPKEKPQPETVEEKPAEKPKEEKPAAPKKESLPKQTDRAEGDRNGVRRKKLYIAFIEWCKDYNGKNSFGSVFDKDIFHVTYPFVPEDMRYFYRLANPLLCVLSGNLTFFAVSELKKINSKNKHLDEFMIFAATENDYRVFNNKDRHVYRAVDENGDIVLKDVLGDTFDTYIQSMIKKGDILNGPIDEYVEFE